MIPYQDYDSLKSVIGINLLDLKLFDNIDIWHNITKFKLDSINEVITNKIFHFFLPKQKYSDIKAMKN